MTERSLVEVMARGAHGHARATYAAKSPPFDQLPEATKDILLHEARAILSAMLEHGPTERMLDEVCSDDPNAIIEARNDVLREVFRDMLRAELGEDAQ